MSAPKVFIDTNVLVSAVAFGGNPAKVLRLAAVGRIRLVLSEAVMTEARDVVARKFPQLLDDLDDLFSKVNAEFAGPPEADAVASALEILRDPNDALILASILLAKPDFAITGDKDLLTDEVKAIAPVCTCAEYLQKLIAES